MVRFSDMLGGSGEPDDVHAANSPYAALASDDPPADPIPETEPEDEVEVEADLEPEAEIAVEPAPAIDTGPALETPEDVLNRLTQYATSARAADPVVEAVVDEPAPELAADEPTPGEPTPEAGDPAEDDPLSPVGDRDDFLPRAKGAVRRAGRGRKRHP